MKKAKAAAPSDALTELDVWRVRAAQAELKEAMAYREAAEAKWRAQTLEQAHLVQKLTEQVSQANLRWLNLVSRINKDYEIDFSKCSYDPDTGQIHRV